MLDRRDVREEPHAVADRMLLERVGDVCVGPPHVADHFRQRIHGAVCSGLANEAALVA